MRRKSRRGNTAVGVASTGGIASALRYDGYGKTLDSYNPASHPTPWKYQGRLDVSPDADEPLYDAGARFYSPAIGAFTQLDSYAGSAQAAWSLNRYLYAGANPTSMIDPDGHAFIDNPGSATGGYRLPPQRHNLVRGAYKEPTPRPTVYIPPAKKPAAVKPAPASTSVIHGTANWMITQYGNLVSGDPDRIAEGIGSSIDVATVVTGVAGAAKAGATRLAERGASGAADVASAIPMAPTRITGYAASASGVRHGLMQAISRDGGRGVSPTAMLEAVRNADPVFQAERGTFLYSGQDAVVILNARGEVVTTWATSGRGFRTRGV